MPALTAEDRLAERLLSFKWDPLGFATYCWPVTLRKFQVEILGKIGKHLQNPATRHQPFRLVVSSGHGIGKTALIGMLVDWAMSTMRRCRGQITAGKADQLATKVWPEVEKWLGSALNAHWWKVSKTSIKANDPDPKVQDAWSIDQMLWSKESSQAVAGLHNQGSRILIIFDEASEIPDNIWNTIEGAQTDEDTEILWLAFSQPTQNTGRFAECFGKFRHRWHTYQIDSREVEGTNKTLFNQWVEDWGEDSDFVRIRVRGEFPRAAWNQFIASDVIAKCRKWTAQGYETLPRILSVDVARFGDDQTVCGERQGRHAAILFRARELGAEQVAARIVEQIQKAKQDLNPFNLVVVDADGIGGSVVDHLKFWGYRHLVKEFHGGERAMDVAKYFNRRAEVWGLLRDALEAGMQIPDEPELAHDLAAPQYGFSSKQQIQLERKEDMKSRGLASPDSGDMLAMTFAVDLNYRPKARKTDFVYSREMDTRWLGA